MPKESYKYIPMTLLKDLMIEFRLNPFAMFTSGYKDLYKVTSPIDITTFGKDLDVNALNSTTTGLVSTNYATAISSFGM